MREAVSLEVSVSGGVRSAPGRAGQVCMSGAEFGMHSAVVWKSGLSGTVRGISSGDPVWTE